MIKKILTPILLLTCFVGFSQSKVDITLSQTEKISVDGKIILNIYPALEDKVSIKGELSIAASDQLSIKEKGGIITLSRKEPMSTKKVELDSIVLNMYIKSPSYIEAKGKSEIYFGKSFEFDKLNLIASGGSDISAITNSKTIDIKATGAGKIIVSGKADDINIVTSGSGYANTIQTECKRLTAVSTTNSESYVRAIELLNLKANSYGNIFYKGIANEIVKTTSTFGHIEKF